MASIPSKPDDRVLRFVKFYGKRIQGRAEDQIARDLDFGSPVALYQKLSQDGFPVCPVCGETPARPNHCAKIKGRRQRRARRGTGQAIELPPAKGAENLFSKAISNMERDLLPLDSRKEVYRDERFETISDYPNASASLYRDTFPPGEAGDEEWRKLCEKYGQDPNVDSFFAENAPTYFSEGATKSPPSPLTELIALYVLANEPLATLLNALHPDPAEANQERLDQAVEELRHKAGQLATLVRGGIIRRGPSTEELTPREQSAARFISDQLSKGTPEAEIREVLRGRGYSQQEFTRLKNLKIEPPQ
jgi:hypothetical protein